MAVISSPGVIDRLIASRKFWILTLGLGVNIAGYFGLPAELVAMANVYLGGLLVVIFGVDVAEAL